MMSDNKNNHNNHNNHNVHNTHHHSSSMMQEYDVDHMMDRNMDDDDGGDDMGEHYIMKNGEVREQDRYLPIANIARIMKTVLPGNAKIAKDAKESIQECVSEFISFITSEASDKCQQEKRKTINGDDLLWAMSTLGFDKYIEPLKLYLSKYRESVKGEKPEKKPAGGGGKKSGGADSSSGGMPSHQAQPKMSSQQHHASSSGAMGVSGMMASSSSSAGMGGMGMMMPGGGLGASGLKGGPGLLPSMSDLSGGGGGSSYNPYDGGAGSLLMGGSLEDSPLFLAPSGSSALGSGMMSGGGGGGADAGILPPLPKKRKEHPPVSMSDMPLFSGTQGSAPNPAKHN